MLDGETMTDMLITNNGSSQVAHDLMHIDQNTPVIFQVKRSWLNVRVNLAPLLRPVSANFLRTTDKATFEGSWPRHIRSHDGKRCIDVSRVKSRVGCAQQFGL